MKVKPENSTLLNVHIVPRTDIQYQCVALSQSLKSPNTMFVLDGKTTFPHMTIYMVRVANEKVSAFVEAAGCFISQEKAFTCNHTGYFKTAGRYYEISYRKSPEIIALQARMIECLKGFRINPGDPYEESYFEPYTEIQQLDAKETGYDLVRGFRPHITLTRWHEGKMPLGDPIFPIRDLSFSSRLIAIDEADDNGVVYKNLATFTMS